MQLCKDLIVVPPAGAQFETPEFIADIRKLLYRAYPNYDFTITIESQYRDDGFVLIPVIGMVGGENSGVATYPDMAKMQEIGSFLFEYINRPSQSRH